MTIQQKIVSTLLTSLVIVSLSLLSVIALIQRSNMREVQTYAESVVSAATTHLGSSIAQTASRSLAQLVAENNTLGVQSTINEIVNGNPEIFYGAFIDEDLVPWVFTTNKNPSGKPNSSNSLADLNSLWASEQLEVSAKALSVNTPDNPHTKALLIASPVNHEGRRLGSVFFALNLETSATVNASPNLSFTALLTGMAILVSLVIAISVFILRREALRITQPIKYISNALRDYCRHNTPLEQIQTTGAGQALEIAKLASQYNTLVEQIEKEGKTQSSLVEALLEATNASTISNLSATFSALINRICETQIVAMQLTDFENREQLYWVMQPDNNDGTETSILHAADMATELNALIKRMANTQRPDRSEYALSDENGTLCQQPVNVTVLPIKCRELHRSQPNNSFGSIFIIEQEIPKHKSKKNDKVSRPHQHERLLSLLSEILYGAIKRLKDRESLRGEITSIKGVNQQLKDSLAERNNDLNAVMKNLHEGVLLINEQGLVDCQYSHKLSNILATSIGNNQHYKEVLFGQSSLSAAAISQLTCTIDTILGCDEVVYEFNRHLLCEELQIIDPSGDNKTLHVHWGPVIEHSIVKKLMITLSDMTHHDALKKTTKAQREELELVAQVLKVKAQRFDDIMQYAQIRMNQNIEAIRHFERSDAIDFDTLFNNIHAIKLESRAHSLTYLTECLHTIENRYDEIRRDPSIPWTIADLLSDLQVIITKIERYKHINHDILKRFASQSTPQISREQLLSISTEINKLKSSIKGEKDRTCLANIESVLVEATTLDLGVLLGQRLENISSIAEPLGKEKPVIKVNNLGYRVNNKLGPTLTDIFDHLLRNSIYHSIEPDKDRAKLNKTKRGTIYVDIAQRNNSLSITFTDDGRGLNTSRLAEKGLSEGVLAPSDLKDLTKVADLIFCPQVVAEPAQYNGENYRYGITLIRELLKHWGAEAHVQLLGPCIDKYCSVAIVLTIPASLFTQSSLFAQSSSSGACKAIAAS